MPGVVKFIEKLLEDNDCLGMCHCMCGLVWCRGTFISGHMYVTLLPYFSDSEVHPTRVLCVLSPQVMGLAAKVKITGLCARVTVETPCQTLEPWLKSCLCYRQVPSRFSLGERSRGGEGAKEGTLSSPPPPPPPPCSKPRSHLLHKVGVCLSP